MELLKNILISIPMISAMTCGGILLFVFYRNLVGTDTPIFRTLGAYYGVLMLFWLLENFTLANLSIRVNLLPILFLLLTLSQVCFYHFVCFFIPAKKKFNYYHYKQAFFLSIMSYGFLYVLSKTEGFQTLDQQYLFSKYLGICMSLSIAYYTFLFWMRLYKNQRAKNIIQLEASNWIHLLLVGKTCFTLLIFLPNRSVLVYSLMVLILVFKHIVITFNIIKEKNRVRIPQVYKSTIMLPSGQIISVDQSEINEKNDVEHTLFGPNESVSNLLTQHDMEVYFRKAKPYTNKHFRLDTIVNYFGVNRTYVSKFINITYKCNVSQFINYWRLKEVDYLQQVDKESSMEHLVIKAGFSDYRHYVRAVRNAEKRQQTL